MDDIFYMTNKKISIIEINDIAKKVNVKSTFIANYSDALQIEYFHGIIADWVSISVKEFSEPEDKIFLSDNKINSIFCISYHPSQFNFVLPHLKALLQKYKAEQQELSQSFARLGSLNKELLISAS